MKVVILAVVLGVGLAEIVPSRDLTAYDYHRRVGIPRVEELLKAERNVEAAGAGRIVGGVPTDIAQVPYQVALVMTILWVLNSLCGGSLVNQNTVLTAAHCQYDGVFNAQSIRVVAGTNTPLSGGGQSALATNVIMHEQWQPLLVRNDIAIVKIPPITFTNTIRPVPLATNRDDIVGQMALASGYGLNADSGGSTGNLYSVNLRVISNEECQQTYGSATITDSIVCTSGEGGRSVCSGDSGGPLVIIINGITSAIGVTSFGHRDGCQQDHPQGFSDVSKFNSWISQYLE